jgi:hypothetical protein
MCRGQRPRQPCSGDGGHGGCSAEDVHGGGHGGRIGVDDGHDGRTSKDVPSGWDGGRNELASVGIWRGVCVHIRVRPW